MLVRNARPIRNAKVVARALTAVLFCAFTFTMGSCKGTAGILLDLWSWDEITQRTDSAVVYVEEGAIEIVAYPRKNVWLQRHVYAFEGSLKTADYSVTNRVFSLTFDCDGPATCFAEHWLEIPEAFPMQIAVDEGSISMLGVSGAMSLRVGDVSVYGEELEVPSIQVEADGAPLVTLGFKMTPAQVMLSGTAKQVELLLPPGHYRCDGLPAIATVDPAIVCDPAATTVLGLAIVATSFSIGPAIP